MTARFATLVAALLAATALAHAGEIGFIEEFSLAEDRAEALKKLIPGTEDYYYYHCLHYQHTGDFRKVHDTLAQWIKRYKYTPRVEEIRNRQALLEYGQDPARSLERIKDVLNLRFDHQKARLARETRHPTRLNPNLISRETLKKDALARHKNNLKGFEDAALDYLVEEDLSPDRRRDLLHRLARPDHPGLVKLVLVDLRYRNSGGFGSHGIHDRMLKIQLDECIAAMPQLLRDTKFVDTYMARLQAGADDNARHDPAQRDAYLTRLLTFTRTLPPVHNSLKAHVLFQKLDFERKRDNYDKALFMEYLKLPRSVPYILPKYLNRPEHRGVHANLNADYHKVTLMPPIGNDEPLVRDYLQHFLVNADSTDAFGDYIESWYLKELFAETKIVNGVGDMEQWYALLPPAKYKALQERVDLDFLPTNPERFAPADAVTLKLALKNVETLIIKQYSINVINYYRQKKEAISTAIDLDGLVPNKEQVIRYQQVPLRRHVETFDLPGIDGAGVTVVEFIGNGRSSRALARKGDLVVTERIGSAGHVFTVHDEERNAVADAELWLDGHAYRPDETGQVTVPFTAKPGRRKAVVSRGNFAVLHSFQHLAEQYTLRASIHADRESLISGRVCRLIVRPELSVNGYPVDIALLEEPVLVIRSVDHEGISTAKEVKDFALHNDRESVYEFRTPENLSFIEFELKGRVEHLAKGEKIDLADARSIGLNGIDKTEKIEDLHLRHAGGEYVLELLGKSGEPKTARAVHVEIKHREFTRKVNTTLQTDEKGRANLGALPDIALVRARGPEGTARVWTMPTDRYVHPASVHAVAGQSISVPFMPSAPGRTRDALSLLETRGGAFVRDMRDAATIRDGFLTIEGLAPGDYSLWLKRSATPIAIRVTHGERRGRALLSANRALEIRDARPLQISAVEVDRDKGEARIRLSNAGPATRVHVAATRFMPPENLLSGIGAPSLPDLARQPITPVLSRYLSGRNIGDEYRYIIERRYAQKRAGNMLGRPSLLLNPWSLGKTETGTQEARDGEAWLAAAEEAEGERVAGRARAARRSAGAAGEEEQGSTSLDFLPAASLILANQVPDENGVVTVNLEDVGPRQQLHVLALNAVAAAYREVSLAARDEQFRDLRIARPLDPAGHYTEQKNVTPLPARQPLVVEDVTSSKLEVYDTLGDVFRLYATLSKDATLTEFGFIVNWPALTPDRKRELYAKYACHELSFFLSHKDPDFFRAVILPYLANKKDKTFLDHWLLGNDLAAYLKPWSFAQLNIVERILLARRIAAEHPATARHVKDLYNLLPPDIEHQNHLFKTAIKGSALETGDDLGLDGRLEQLALAPAAAPGEVMAFGAMADTAEADGKPQTARAKVLKAEGLRALARKAAPTVTAEAARGPVVASSDMLGEAKQDRARRRETRRFYRKLDQTEEWAENNYYHLRIGAQVAGLVTVNGFWTDYAAHAGDAPFLSPRVAEASRSFTEMMFALAVLDLPFEAEAHDTRYEGTGMTLTPSGAVIVFHKEVKEAARDESAAPILVSQGFFAHDDRYRFEDNERFDKFVTSEFRTARVYGGQVILTNPTSARRKIDVLLQIPRGAIPVLNGFYTRSRHYQLEPYATTKVEYYFYFPAPGDQAHYPVHVSQNEQTVASADPFVFHVVDTLTEVDRESWSYISQNGTGDEVLAFLQENNIDRLDMDLVAFRMRDKAFFGKSLALLEDRHVYNHTLWSYGLYHADTAAAREYLQHSPFAGACGLFIDTELLTVDPVARHAYEHKEYWPLVNARAYQLGRARRILNEQFFAQYTHFMTFLSYRPALTLDDMLAVAGAMLLQDRVDEALSFFTRVPRDAVKTVMQYDYLRAYLAFSRGVPDEAREIAIEYEKHPVPRWRNRFREVLAQADEIRGAAAKVVDERDRAQQQTRLADTEASIDFEVENREIVIRYQNVKSCLVNFYLMDVELLFSRNPFVKDVSGQFAIIHPNESMVVDLPADRESFSLDLPARFRDSNVMIEITAGAETKARPYYPHSMSIQVVENYGHLRIGHAATGKPLPQVYIKVYARMKGGEEKFYKDGYTDLRGRFDYTSLNTDEIQHVERFAVLVMSEKNGAVVREAAPPKM